MAINYRQTDLKRTSRGDYVRNLGFDPAGKQPKFRLGFDKAEATKRVNAILGLWQFVCERPKELQIGGRPAWDAVRLRAAQAIAKGETPLLPCGDFEEPMAYFERVNKLTKQLGIKFQADGCYTIGAQDARQLVNDVNHILEEATGQTLHQALTAYSAHIGREFMDAHGTLTDNGRTKQDQVRTIITYVPDWDLAKLGYAGCDEVFGIFRRRPLSKRYKRPMTRKSCSNYIGELSRFFHWLHMNADFRWQRPDDFNFIKRSPREIDADAEQESQDVKTWKIGELKTLYGYASPLEQVFLLLGLNCSYGADQAGRLRIAHLHLSDSPDRQSFIRRIRRKKRTRSIHVLWKPTEQGLRWVMARRPEGMDNDFLVLNQNGKPYWRQTKGGHRAQDIPKLWNRLLDRIQKDHPQFRRLSFNSLRDTSADFVRRLAGEEIASLHLAHKHQSPDENLGRYTNPVRRKHVKALLRLEQKLASVFEAIPDLFPTEQEKVQLDGGANLSVRQIRKIDSLFSQGFKREKIAEIVGISRTAVWRRTRKPKPR